MDDEWKLPSGYVNGKEDDLDKWQGIFFDRTLGDMIGMVIVCGNYVFGKGPVKMMEDSKTWTKDQWMAARLLNSKKGLKLCAYRGRPIRMAGETTAKTAI